MLSLSARSNARVDCGTPIQNASATLAAMVCTVLALSITVDSEHRVRNDRILKGKHAIWQARDRAIGGLAQAFEAAFIAVSRKIQGVWKKRGDNGNGRHHGERQGL